MTMLDPALQTEYVGEIDWLVEQILDETGIQGPPVDALQIAAALGIDVVSDASQQARGRCKRIGNRPLIVLQPDDRPERIHWAAAHEIGELTSFRLFRRLVGDEEIAVGMREQAANLIAGRLLLPTRWFADDATWLEGDLPRLKTRYSTASHELIAMRMLDLPEASIVSIFDQGRLTRRRVSGHSPAPSLQLAERHCWRIVHETSRPWSHENEQFKVVGWPVHEPGWKREILRTWPVGIDDDIAGA